MDGTILGKKYDIINGGGGGGGTSDYEQLSNLPKINNVELKGNKSLNALGIYDDAGHVSYDGTTSGLEATSVQAAIDEMVANFGDGVDEVYNACVSAGSTPATKSPTDIATAIGSISGGADIRLDNGQIANTETYISANFSENISTNDNLLISVHDGSEYKNFIHKYSGSTDTFQADVYEFTLTAGTIGLSYYSGDYRNIYAIVSVLSPDQLYSPAASRKRKKS